MMVPPLSERPVTEEDEEQFRRESTPRTYTLRERWADYRADAKRNRPKGAGGVWVFRIVCCERVVLSSPGCLWPGRMDDYEEVFVAHASSRLL